LLAVTLIEAKPSDLKGVDMRRLLFMSTPATRFAFAGIGGWRAASGLSEMDDVSVE